MPTKAGEVLRKAADLVDGPREHDHGEKQASFEGIARTWNAYLENKWKRTLDSPINAVDVAQLMVLLKMTRPQFGAYSEDHALDQCGYSGIVGQLAAYAERGPDDSMSAILALDLGTKTGYALGTGGTTISGVWDFKNRRFEGGGMRYLRFRKALDEIHEATPLATVVFEEVRSHMGVDAAHAYGGFMAHLTAWCEEQAVPYQGVPVGTIKKYATGKGNASKEKMIEVARRAGYEPEDDNEADALMLALPLAEERSVVMMQRFRQFLCWWRCGHYCCIESVTFHGREAIWRYSCVRCGLKRESVTTWDA